jgi:transposase InsO family protein
MQVHPPPLPVDQRESGTVQPDLQDEFAYARPWLSNTDRLAALDSWVHAYNTRRAHSAIGGRPPISRLAS